MMETGKMTIVVALARTVYLKEQVTERFILVDGKMTKDMYVSVTFNYFSLDQASFMTRIFKGRGNRSRSQCVKASILIYMYLLRLSPF